MKRNFIFCTALCFLIPFLHQGPAWGATATKRHLQGAVNFLGIQPVNIYEDAGIIKLPVESVVSDAHTYHVFSHGRPGELLLDGAWRNWEQIATFLKSRLSPLTSHINIYGCEFGKGQKGKAAVANLQQALGITVSASDDVTGKDGDWELEVGMTKNTITLPQYNYNLQCAGIAGGTGANDDYDRDGVCNGVDLDDDNDGIPDKVECPSYFTNMMVNGGFTKTASELFPNWYMAQAYSGNSYNYETYSPHWNGGQLFGYGDSDGQRNSDHTGGLFDEVDGNNANTGIIAPLTEDPSNPIVGKIGQLTASAAYDYSFDIALRGNSVANNQDYVVMLYNATTHAVEKEIVRKSLSTLYYYRKDAGWYEYLKGEAGYQTIAGTFTANANAQYYLIFKTEGPGNREDDFVIDRVAIRAATPCDTDGDGIPDHFDLDSDGDGCSDAMEGGTNVTGDPVTLSNLVISSIPGGNSGTGYSGTAGPVVYNLGSTVDANGVPTIVSGGQTSGSSQNAAAQVADCTPKPVAVPDKVVNNNPGSPVSFNITTNDTGGDPVNPSTVNLIVPRSGGSCEDTDSDGDCDKLTIPGEGVWTVTTTGIITFTPVTGFTNDPTPITYSVKGTGGSTSNIVSVTIDNVPVAVDDTGTGTKGNPVTVNAVNNDKGGDTVDPATVQIVGTTNIGDPLTVNGEGTWTVNTTTGAITFTPQSGFTGQPTPIHYTVKDAEGNTSNTAKVTVTYIGALPVTLISFSAIEGSEGVKLIWRTANEKDFDRFEIEYSQLPQAGFALIGEVKGGGSDYSYTDVVRRNGASYYRLKMVDTDGTFTYSRIVAVTSRNGVELNKVYPNPSRDGVIRVATNGAIESCTIYDISGRSVQMQLSGQSGYYQIKLAADSAPGLYLINYKAGGKVFSQKFMLGK